MSAYPTQTEAAARCQGNTLCVSLELSKARWSSRLVRLAATSSRGTTCPAATSRRS
jgi:hypothetical protein